MTTQARPRRYLRNYLLEPEIQLKRAYYFVAFFFCMVAGIYFWVHFQLLIAVELLDAEHGLVAVRVTDLVASLSWVTILAYLISGAIASVLFAIHSSHRVIGPSVAIRKQLERMMAGNYSERVHLRKGDELVTVAKYLNELTDVLREKYGK